MTRVLVTGASGQLGAFAVEELVAAGHRLSTLDLAPSRTPELPHLDASVLDPASLAVATEGVECVVHLAALDAAVPAADRDYVEVNALGTWHVLEAAERAGVRRVVVCSSVAAVGLGPGVPADFLPVDETHPCRPVHAYGVSKHLVEQIAGGFARRGAMDVVCLRPAFIVFPGICLRVAGALAREDGASWSPALPAGLSPPVEPLTPTRAWVAADDVARGVAAAVAAPAGPAFRCCFLAAPTSMPAAANGPTTVQRVSTFGGPAPALRDAQRYAADPRASVFASDVARAELGWTPRTTFDDVLREARESR